MDKLHKITVASALFFNSALLLGALYFLSSGFAQEEQTINFALEGKHQEDTVGQVLSEAFGYNMTVFEPLPNGTIIVNATTK
jgi:hypothetical protein